MLRDMFKKTYTKIDMREKRNLPERQRRTRR